MEITEKDRKIFDLQNQVSSRNLYITKLEDLLREISHYYFDSSGKLLPENVEEKLIEITKEIPRRLKKRMDDWDRCYPDSFLNFQNRMDVEKMFL